MEMQRHKFPWYGYGQQNIQAKAAYCFIIRSIKTDVSLLALAKSI